MIKYQFRTKEGNEIPNISSVKHNYTNMPQHAVPEGTAIEWLEWYDEVLSGPISDHIKLIEMHGGRTYASVNPDVLLEQGGK